MKRIKHKEEEKKRIKLMKTMIKKNRNKKMIRKIVKIKLIKILF